MSSALDMSLEDLIKKNKKPGGGNIRGGRGGGRGAGPGPARRFPTRAGNRAVPYSGGKLVQAPGSTWQHDLFSDPVAAYPAAGPSRASAIETGTKLYISNLEYGVSNEDVKELFSEVGDLKRSSIHYDRSGRSKVPTYGEIHCLFSWQAIILQLAHKRHYLQGTAEVVFSRRADAVAAVKRYNNVQLDGKPMKIEIVGTNIVTPPAPVPQISNSIFGNPNGFLRSGPGRGGTTGLSRGGGRGRGRGRGQGRGRGDPVSAADLDAELDKYHSAAMQIN